MEDNIVERSKERSGHGILREKCLSNYRNRMKNRVENQGYTRQIMLDVGKGFYKELKKVAMDKEERRKNASLNQITD